MEALEEVFGEEVCDEQRYGVTRKLQSWSCKVAHATCGHQVSLDANSQCMCKTQCRITYVESYANQIDCEDALLQLRAERTEGNQRGEAVWLFHQLFSSRCRVRAGFYFVWTVLQCVNVISQLL